MDWREIAGGKEAAHWKGKYERSIDLCKAIWEYHYYIEEIKLMLKNDPVGAAQMWNELDYQVQKLLITAPLYGGPFTTEERARVKELWEISTDDIEGVGDE